MLKDMTILYVEDDLDIAEEIGFFLKKRVKELFVAHDGAEGWEKFETNKPDVVITDIQMPKMNGLKLSRKIREQESEIPIIIVSAYNDNEYLSEAIDLNISGYIVKPIDLQKMVQTIEKVFEPVKLKKELAAKNRLLQELNEHLDKKVKEKTQELESFYYHEALTGLYNSVKLNEDMGQHIGDYLILLDISNFSVLNKQYGKHFANEVLKETAKSLEKLVNYHRALYKIESDRFVFILNKKEDYEEFCRELIAYFDNNFLLVEEHPIVVTFNIGISTIEDNIMSIINAEYALDISKKLGSRYYSYFNQDDRRYRDEKEMIEWLDITQNLILSNSIEPYFQPIYSIKENKIGKFEVLARGFIDDKVIAPVHFLESARRLGLITTITKMIINKSFAFFAENEYDFSINITDRDLDENYLEDFLVRKLKKYGIKPQRLTLEVLENVTVSKLHGNILEQLRSLKKLGIKIAIDDFGAENSNFSRLVDIDFDYIKLDALFIKNLDVNEKDRIVVKAMVQLAKALGITTVAEFVKNKKIYEIITECGVDCAQGYFIGKPHSDINIDTKHVSEL